MKKLIFLLLMLVSSLAFPQRYTVVSASSGGDIGDLIQRTALANVEFVAEYSPGGAGLIAPSKFAAKPPGNYLLMSGLMTQQVVGPKLHPERAQYSDADLVPITLLAVTHFVVVAHPQAVFPRGRIAVAGSNAQFVARLIGRKLGVQMQQVAYKGIAQGILDTARGDVEFSLVQRGTAEPHLVAGRVRLAGEFPDIPAAFGLYGQRGMPAAEAGRIVRAVTLALGSAGARAVYSKGHLRAPTVLGPGALTEFVASQRKAFSSVMER